MTTRALPLATVLAVSSLLVAAPAAAQPADSPAAADDGRGYEYRFVDDLLAGGGIDGSAPVIRVNPRALRSQLIRPRTSFVPELLKSGESF